MIIHGMYGTPEYVAWASMKQRCSASNIKDYHNYYGRGISVCKRWHEFVNFFADMGFRPAGKHGVDRINNSKGYEPGNCRWATPKENCDNTRNQKWFFAFNERTGEWDEDDTQIDFAERHQVGQGNIGNCLQGKRHQANGWIFTYMGI